MTHLKIEQNDSAIEQVSSSVIEKLYELATSGDLDLSSNLVGRLHTTATYLEYIDELTTDFANLHITADKPYVRLIDPEITRALATLYGDGTGITQTELTLAKSSITSFSGLRATASNIVSTEDLALFTSITQLDGSVFRYSTSLRILDLTNITSIGPTMCHECTSLQLIKNTNNLTYIGTNCFQGCTNLSGNLSFPNLTTMCAGSRIFSYCSNITGFSAPNVTGNLPERTFEYCSSLTGDIILKKITYIGGAAFAGCTGLWIFLEDISEFSWNVFYQSSNINLVINNTTVPTVLNNTFDVRVNIYVPDSAVSTYKSSLLSYSSQQDKIKPISELPADKLAIVNAS